MAVNLADSGPTSSQRCNIAAVACAFVEQLATGNTLFVADDDQQAEAIAAAAQAIAPDRKIVFLPSSDALPGDEAPASPANIGRRVAALRELRRSYKDSNTVGCVLSGEAAAHIYPSPDTLDAAPPILNLGDVLDTSGFANLVADIGYVADDRVDEPGEVAIRGDVIDIFPADAGGPVRIEIADSVIAAIRSYDAATQRTIEDLGSIEIGRAADPRVEATTSILAHLKPGRLACSGKADARRNRFLTLAQDVAKRRSRRLEAIDGAAWQTALSEWELGDWGLQATLETPPRFVEAKSPLAACSRFVKPMLAEHALVLVGSERDLRFLRPKVAARLKLDISTLSDWSEARALPPGAAGSVVMPVDRGFVDDTLAVIAAGDLLGSRAILGENSPIRIDPLAMASAELRTGDIVIHEDHGIGKVAGLEAAPDGSASELIALEFAAMGRRLVAIQAANRIWRYGGDAEAVTLDKLDGSTWQKRRAQISAALAETAQGLTALAAERDEQNGAVLIPEAADYERFVNGFAFNETADQARAIGAVRDDLASGKPMDRLIVGDVGYGKTEVALRAAAIAALAGYQVIVAAPTTVLVRQHIETFVARFEGTGVKVAGLSRLSSDAEKRAVKAGLADGSIGIVVGTAAVAGKGVNYTKLGLVIIDEEQRFGAADKARLRGSGSVHLLSLSATPIPRTLQMAMVGLQKISVIGTPPARRQPIRTSLDRFDDGRVRTALLREKSRGGQSFVVVPRIEDMKQIGERLRRVVPDLSIVEAHGKMAAQAIDTVMVDFAQGRGDVLLATNIIEAGLDVPRANTMLIWRADRFGLAQLHQLRGRVGRGNRRGQVVLLTKEEGAIGDRTMKRLGTLAALSQLGAGFNISANDLDMRGGGELLGDTQAGHMKLIGIELYQHLLSQALRKARGEEVEDWPPELKIEGTAWLPADWIPEADIRLGLYVRLARLCSEAALESFEVELVDRFGPLPEPAAALLDRARLSLQARAANIARIDAGPAAIALTPRPSFVRANTTEHLIEKNGRLLLAVETTSEDRIPRIQQLLEDVAGGG